VWKSLCGIASRCGPHFRVAVADEKIYIDISDESWRAIEIDAEGWRIVDAPPPGFWDEAAADTACRRLD